MNQILSHLIFSLNCIEVRGRENLDTLLGCIQTLEKLRDMVRTERREIKEEIKEAKAFKEIKEAKAFKETEKEERDAACDGQKRCV